MRIESQERSDAVLVEAAQGGRHARAECIRRKSENHIVITRPQWHHFDNDWWQIDD